jgi:hypothetical protein
MEENTDKYGKTEKQTDVKRGYTDHVKRHINSWNETKRKVKKPGKFNISLGHSQTIRLKRAD